MNSLNLKTISSHVSVDRLKNNLTNEIEYLKALGANYMVCAFADIHTIDNATEYAKFFSEIGEELAKHDISLMYHNHSHELVK